VSFRAPAVASTPHLARSARVSSVNEPPTGWTNLMTAARNERLFHRGVELVGVLFWTDGLAAA